MTQKQSSEISLYGLYAGIALIVVAAGASLMQRGGMSTAVFSALIVGLVLVVISFLSSGAVSGRQAKYGTNTLVMVILFTGILALGYYTIRRNPVRFDLTKQGLFTLSDQTIKIVEELKQPVQAIAFLTPGQSEEYTSVKELLDGYARLSKEFTVEYVDPYVSPVRARDLKIQEPGTVVFLSGEGPEPKKFSVSKSDYVEIDYSQAQMGQQPTSSFKGEQAFTTALLNVTGGEKRKIYMLAGHGEEPLSGDDPPSLSHFKDALESEGYSVEELHLSKTQQVPQDCSVLIVAGPKSPLLPLEAQLLVNYVKGGGKMMLLPSLIGTPTLDDVVGPFGLKIGDDVVIDPQSRSIFSPYVTVAAAYEFHEITDKINEYTLFTAARSIAVTTPNEAWKASALIKTTDAAWGETDPQRPRFDQGVDAMGPLDLMVLVEGAASDVPAEVQPEGPGIDLGLGNVELPAPAAEPTPPQPVAPVATPGGGQGGGNAEIATPAPAPAPEAAPPEAAPEAAPAPAPEAGAPVPAPEAAPVPAGDAAPKTLRWSDQGRLAVIASSAVIRNDNFLEGANRDLALNTVGWLVGKRELISIRSKDTHLPQLTMSAAEVDNVWWIALIFVPGLILILGISVWYQRR